MASWRRSTATSRPPSARPRATEPNETSKPSSTSSPVTCSLIHPFEIATSLPCSAAWHVGRQSHRRIRYRLRDRLSVASAVLGPRVAAPHHYRLLRRPHHVLDLFGRSRILAAGGTVCLDGGSDRRSCHRIVDNDHRRTRILASAEVVVRSAP